MTTFTFCNTRYDSCINNNNAFIQYSIAQDNLSNAENIKYWCIIPYFKLPNK